MGVGVVSVCGGASSSHALGTRTKFQLESFNINAISGFVYFREIIFESSRNVCETTPGFTLHKRISQMGRFTTPLP